MRMSERFLYFLVIFSSLLCLITTDRDKFPKGHGEELGKHRTSDGHVDILDNIPSPREFWAKYASVRRPVVFRGAGKKFPAFKLWTDEYMKENFGDMVVKLEGKKEKEKVPVGERGLGQDTIRSFLNTYQQKDSYIVSQLPDAMSKEVLVLPVMMCGSFYERILEANLWLSSGGTKSLLHKDADNAINCLLNGTKNWILIHPDNERNIPVAEGDKGYGGFAVLDVDKVNLIKYPEVKEVHWQYANLTPGDCLFLPYSYWHQVRSYGSKNMAVSVLFSRLTSFDPKGCDSTEKLKFTPLNDTNMVWTYPGHGPQTMGNLDPFELRDNYLRLVHSTGQLGFKEIFEELTESNIMEEHEQQREKMARKIVSIMDTEGKGYATVEDVKTLTLDQLRAVADEIDADPANTEEYEHAIFNAEEVRAVFMDALETGDGKLTLKNLINTYEQQLGGSPKVARELFEMLRPNNADYLTEGEVVGRLDSVLQVYREKVRDDDKSGEYYEANRKEDEKMMKEMEKQTRTGSESEGKTKIRDEF